MEITLNVKNATAALVLAALAAASIEVERAVADGAPVDLELAAKHQLEAQEREAFNDAKANGTLPQEGAPATPETVEPEADTEPVVADVE